MGIYTDMARTAILTNINNRGVDLCGQIEGRGVVVFFKAVGLPDWSGLY